MNVIEQKTIINSNINIIYTSYIVTIVKYMLPLIKRKFIVNGQRNKNS